MPRVASLPRALADPPRAILPPRSPVRVGTAHTTKSTRPHPLLARLMRERLREHSRHLEAQHREAGGDSASDSDDDGPRDVAGTSRATSPSNGADSASIVDDFDLHEDEDGGGGDNDSDAAGLGLDDSEKKERARTPRAAPATPEGRRLVDLVRAEAAARDDAGASPSQRRVNALLRMERRAEAERERGRGGPPGRGGSAAFARRANPDARPAARSSFLDFAGSFFGRGSDAKPGEKSLAVGTARDAVSAEMPPKSRLSEKQAARLFHRLHSEKKKQAERDPDETFKPRISKKTRAIGAAAHARENGGLPRVEYLLQKGTNVLRERAARTAKLERLGGRERTAEDVEARVIDPSRFFLDGGSGRPIKPGDSYVRAIGALRDQQMANDKTVCTFKPRLTKASRAIAAARDAADPSSARRGPLGMYARGLEFMERRKREAAAAEAARAADEEKECTFRPKSATRVPGFMRVIAAKMRRGRDAEEALDPDEATGALEGPGGAMVSAARRRQGWLASPTFSLSGWAESLGIKAGGASVARGAGSVSADGGEGTAKDRFGDENVVDAFVADATGASVTVRAGALSFPSAPVDHPAVRRAGAHVPIKSAASHYGFRDEGERSAAAALEDARLAARAAEAAHAANLESLFGDVADADSGEGPAATLSSAERGGGAPPASPLATRLTSGAAGYFRDVDRRIPPPGGGVRGRLLGSRVSPIPGERADARDASLRDAWRSAESRMRVAETDYFERKHLERKQLGRLEASQKAARLTKYDGSSWQNRVTEPRAPALGRKPDMSKVTALRRPLTSKTSWTAETGGRRPLVREPTSLSNSVGPSWRGDARGVQETPAAAAPPASPLAARLAGGAAGYFRDVHRRARDPGSFPASRQTSPDTHDRGDDLDDTHDRFSFPERRRAETSPRGPPGWSDFGGVFGGDLGGGAAETAQRAVFGGSGNESDRNFHDDFGEFRSEGEYDSEFE